MMRCCVDSFQRAKIAEGVLDMRRRVSGSVTSNCFEKARARVRRRLQYTVVSEPVRAGTVKGRVK